MIFIKCIFMSLGNLLTGEVVCTCLNGHITLKRSVLTMQILVSLDIQSYLYYWLGSKFCWLNKRYTPYYIQSATFRPNFIKMYQNLRQNDSWIWTMKAWLIKANGMAYYVLSCKDKAHYKDKTCLQFYLVGSNERESSVDIS